MVGEYRSHKLPQAWERQKKLPLLFCFPLHFCWDDFAAPFPCPLLSGQEQEVALPCVLCMCGFMYGLSQPSLFGCLHPKKAMPSLGSVPAFLLTLSERGPSHVFEADTFLFCLSAAHSQRPSFCFSLSFSGWLLANFNKGTMLSGLVLVSASIAFFPYSPSFPCTSSCLCLI